LNGVVKTEIRLYPKEDPESTKDFKALTTASNPPIDPKYQTNSKRSPY